MLLNYHCCLNSNEVLSNKLNLCACDLLHKSDKVLGADLIIAVKVSVEDSNRLTGYGLHKTDKVLCVDRAVAVNVACGKSRSEVSLSKGNRELLSGRSKQIPVGSVSACECCCAASACVCVANGRGEGYGLTALDISLSLFGKRDLHLNSVALIGSLSLYVLKVCCTACVSCCEIFSIEDVAREIGMEVSAADVKCELALVLILSGSLGRIVNYISLAVLAVVTVLLLSCLGVNNGCLIRVVAVMRTVLLGTLVGILEAAVFPPVDVVVAERGEGAGVYECRLIGIKVLLAAGL